MPLLAAVPDPTDGSLAHHVRVLIVDDEPMNLELLDRCLRDRYQLIAASSPEKALEIVHGEDRIGLILSDYRMPGMSGAELLASAAKSQPRARRVLVTGYPESDNVIAAVNSGGVHHILRKPWAPEHMLSVCDRLADQYLQDCQTHSESELLHATNLQLRDTEIKLRGEIEKHVRDAVSGAKEIERLNRELEVLAYRDIQTGLYNHRAFKERLEEELARARRSGQPLSLLYGDIDRFAEINRELGYQIGDEILRSVANLMCAEDSEERVRASDIVARYGGEEFVILLPETPKAGAQTKANRLRNAFSNARFPGGWAVTMSFGVASFPGDAATGRELVSRAEAAQLAAKRGGRNRVHLYSAEGLTVQRFESRTDSSDMPELSEFSTYHERMRHIVAMLRRDRAASCLYVDLSRLRRVEHELGISEHVEIFNCAGRILDDMRGDHLRSSDIVCRTEDEDAYLCILSPARKPEEYGRFPLETIASRVEEHLTSQVTPQVRDLIRDAPRITVGHSRVLNNSMVRPERLISRLITEACESAALRRDRAAQHDKALLQDVILSEGLTPVYQPIVHLKTGQIFGFEALARGPAQTSLETPSSLFSVADDVGLTFELDRACFRSALRSAVGLEPVHRLFVNLLPLSFYDSAFIETEVSHLLDAASLTPANVVFEITERLAIENFASFRKALERYTAMGFGVAIDDVGTKHSNLESVMALRPNLIKISDVLTRGVARSTVKREMLTSLGRIAEAIDAVIIAEGIETPDDLVVLYDLGVSYGQGFFLSRPGPPFPKLRRSVRRALETLAEAPREAIPAPPADFDDHGDFTESATPTTGVRRAVLAMAEGSGSLALAVGSEPSEGQPAQTVSSNDARCAAGLDDFNEATRPRFAEGGWVPLSASEFGGESEEGGVSLIDDLRLVDPTEVSETEPPPSS